jgi:hypothetical protein
VAERRDLIVATYSLVCATGVMATATVCTGRPCIAGPAVAGFFWQPVATSAIARPPIEKMRNQLLSVT